jgi:hypothetical protein
MADERGSGKGSVFMFGQSSGAHGREHLGKCAFLVIPAKAGIQFYGQSPKSWIPAFAGMTATDGRGFFSDSSVVRRRE